MNIYVGNLSYRASEEDVRQAFSSHGQVDSVKIIMDRETGNSKGFGFVEMSSDDEAKAAIESMNGQEFMQRKMVVNEARPRPPRGGGFRGGGRGGDRGGDRGDRGGRFR